MAQRIIWCMIGIPYRRRAPGWATTEESRETTMLKSQAAVKPLKDLYELDELPALGHVPEKMYAWAIRRERHGPPQESFQVEVVPTWSIGEEEVLLLVMAGGVNYNGIWAGLGQPISPFDVHKAPFHVAGSDCAGIV